MGADFAHHFVALCISRAQLQNKSIAIIYLDLERAYDMIVRELVYGQAQNFAGDLRTHLLQLGLAPDLVEQTASQIEADECLLSSLGVDATVVEMVRAIHSRSWARVGELSTILCTSRGGRQGCKFGSLMFNMVYAIALKQVFQECMAEGIVDQLAFDKERAPWQPPSDDAACTSALEATFVDDQAYVVTARTPEALDRKIEMLLLIVTRVFGRFALRINWKPGKSAAMLLYRSKGANQATQRRRDETGKMWIALPASASAERLEVVSSFVHLGSKCDVRANLVKDAMHRAGQAQAAVGKLSRPVFQSQDLSRERKLRFNNTLVCTRLLYQVQLWPTTAPRALAKLEVPYARALRRVAGETYSPDKPMSSDKEIRIRLHCPSVATLIVQKRLLYLRRVVVDGPDSLWAVMQASAMLGGERVRQKWCDTILSDLRWLLRLLPSKLAELEDPENNWHGWKQVILDKYSWRSLVRLAVSRSVVTALAPDPHMPIPCHEPLLHACPTCRVAFRSQKALAQHQRIAHNVRSSWREFISTDSRCPVCNVAFSTRNRAIAHLSDHRRNKPCRQKCLSGEVARIPHELLLILDVQAKEDRAAARKDGYTQPLSRGIPRKAG